MNPTTVVRGQYMLDFLNILGLTPQQRLGVAGGGGGEGG